MRIDDWLVKLSVLRRSGRNRKRRRVVRALVYWPASEWDAMAERWPQFVPEYGDDHDTHRRMVEHMLRRHAEDATATLAVASLTVDGLVEFAESRDLDSASSETRAAYAQELARSGKVTSWPPALRQKCWCGSGLSYRECCDTTR